MKCVYLILTSASSPQFKKRNKNSTLNILNEFANANDYMLSFYKNQTPPFPHKFQFSVRLVHAATLLLFYRKVCKSFHKCLVLELKHFKQKLPEGSHALSLSKALTQDNKEPDSWVSRPNLQPTSLCGQMGYIQGCWGSWHDH